MLCEDPARPLSDDENWTDALLQVGYAGAPEWRMVGTEADLNDHWVELVLADQPPDMQDWDRIVCCDFRTDTGAVHVMGLMDDTPAIAACIASGPYAAYICALNPGVDAEGDAPPTDAELAARDDVERYRVILIPGRPAAVGVLHDPAGPASGT